MDENGDDYINFRELVLGLAFTSRAELEDRLKFFYAVHLFSYLPDAECASPGVVRMFLLED